MGSAEKKSYVNREVGEKMNEDENEKITRDAMKNIAETIESVNNNLNNIKPEPPKRNYTEEAINRGIKEAMGEPLIDAEMQELALKCGPKKNHWPMIGVLVAVFIFLFTLFRTECHSTKKSLASPSSSIDSVKTLVIQHADKNDSAKKKADTSK